MKQKIKSSWESLYTWLSKINENPRQKFRFLAIATFLSLFSVRFIPFSYRFTIPFALDFGNGYWFQNCLEHQNNPFLVPGKVCGDVLGRPMIYPPVMYWSYIWTRGLSFAVAAGIWTLVIAVGIFIGIRTLPEYQKKRGAWALYLCLLLQFPTLFAIERGNNDILVVIIWAFLLLAWIRKSYFAAGLCGGLAFMLKLYPATALFIWGIGFLINVHRSDDWKMFLRRPEFKFGLGFLVATIAIFLFFINQNQIYFTQVLPEWMNSRQGRDVSIHSLYSIIPGADALMVIFSLVLIVSWTKICSRKMQADPVFVWTGLLALSTYFSGISNDYNLVTTYPLIALCWFRSFSGTQKNTYFAFFAFSFLGAIGIRWFWKNPIFHLVGLHVVFQVLWLSFFLIFAPPERKKLQSVATTAI